MEFYYDKKKIFTYFLISLICFGAAVSAIVFIFDYADNNEFSSIMPLALIVLFPAALIAVIYLLTYTFQFLKSDQVLMRIDEQGIFLNMSKAHRKAGLINWNGISNIIKSTDNMNKPAIRISLEGHINSVYQFYITNKDAKNMGETIPQLLDKIMAYYNANKKVTSN